MIHLAASASHMISLKSYEKKVKHKEKEQNMELEKSASNLQAKKREVVE